MIKVALFLLTVVAMFSLFLFVSSDCRMSRNINGAVVDGTENIWKLTVGRAQKGVEHIGYQIQYKTRDAVDSLREGVRSVDQKALDVTITAAVKMKLANDDKVSASRINVDTKEGVVILSGTVSSEGESDRAADLAGSVEGVYKVVSHLRLTRQSKT